MVCIVSIICYPKWLSFFGILSMAIFHLPLKVQKNISFYKLMGTGKNGGFDIQPQWNQWVILRVIDKGEIGLPQFIQWFLKMFNCTSETFFLKPYNSYGVWDGKKCFGNLSNKNEPTQTKIAVLTRATIRFSKLNAFWKNVPAVNTNILNSKGLIYSIGMGEIPLIKQATLSIWENIDAMKSFAYQQKEHVSVIQKTRKEDWYSEEMFTRFEVLENYP